MAKTQLAIKDFCKQFSSPETLLRHVTLVTDATNTKKNYGISLDAQIWQYASSKK